jgi:2,3-bisphosphoglycerate-independent phosphoglycerate mutase
MIVTGDHGNVEQMIDPITGSIETEHNSNPVPFIAVGQKFSGNSVVLTSGILADIAPTILNLLQIHVPSSMMGRNLLATL